MKRSYFRQLCVLLAVLLLLTACGGPAAAPDNTEPAGTNPPATEPVTEPAAEIAFDQVGILLTTGQSQAIPASGAAGITYTSSNPAVATVDAGGTVTAVGKGNAVITATAGGGEATCGVIVDLEQTALIDIRQMTPKMLVSEQPLAHASVMRNVIVMDGEFYYIQRNDSTPCDLTLQHLDKDGNLDEWMSLIGFGGGVSISADKGADGKWYLWTESNGNAASEGQTISRIPYEPGTAYQNQGGLTWYFNQTEGAAYASVDQENGLVCVRTVCPTGYRFTYYDYENMISGATPIPLYRIELTMLTSTLDKEINPNGLAVGEYTFRGFAVYGQYIYQYYGTANSAIVLAVYDMNGNGVYVHRVNEFGNLVFREPDGMTISDGQLYLCISTGESGDRRANVLRYE